jgi:hypothetical protein
MDNELTDRTFFDDFLKSNSEADLFVFGFQELVDLESVFVTYDRKVRLLVIKII